MEKSTATRDAAFGSDKKTQTASAPVRTIDGPPETKKPSEENTTSAEKLEAGTGDCEDAPAENTFSRAETPRPPAKVLGYVGGLVTWVPKNCRYDPQGPPKFNLALNLLFALVSSHLHHERTVDAV